MTEDEANLKACCGGGSQGHYNAEGPAGPARYCIASACMAWRVRHQWLDNAQQEPEWVSYAPYAFEPGPGQERDDGYCGLAGAPA